MEQVRTRSSVRPRRIHTGPVKVLPTVLMLALVLFPQTITAQAPTWGVIGPADLELTGWPDDPDAIAAVLADVGEVHFTGDFQLVFTRYRRVKIFSESAFDTWGTVMIPYYANGQKVEMVEGMTTSPAGSGSSVRTNLDPGSLLDEDAANRSMRQIRFTLPDLRPGCIVEYRYTVRSEGGTFLRSWNFGTDQPTRWSEFVAVIPNSLVYIMVRRGLTSFSAVEENEVDWPTRLAGFERAQKHKVKQTRYRWVMKDVPAIRREPFITLPADYVPRIRFQLARWSWPGFESEPFIKDWQTVAEGVEAELGSCPGAESMARKLTRNVTDPHEKMRIIHDYVRRTVTWNGSIGRTTDKVCKAWENRKGGSDDIAAILTLMLRKADLEAHPVLISTRDNGKPIDEYPLVSQFNRELTLVIIDGTEYLIDATDPLAPLDVLPFETLNEIAFVADPENASWTEIPFGSSGTVTEVRAVLSEEGVLDGRITSRSTGHAALQIRHQLQDQSEKEYLDEVWLRRFGSGMMDSARIANGDSADAPLVLSAHISVPAIVNAEKLRVYLDPTLVKAVEQNPFKNPRRVLPVDFGYSIRRTYLLTLDVPGGWTLETTPEDVLIELPDGGGRLIRKVESAPGQVRLMRELILSRPQYARRDFEALRSCYNRLLAIDSEQLVFVQRPARGEGQ